MGLFNSKNKEDKKKESEYKTETVIKLCKTQKEIRDEKWSVNFLNNVSEAYFFVDRNGEIEDENFFPYVNLFTNSTKNAIERVKIKDILTLLMEKGFGLLINPNKDEPDFVFVYGQIVNYYIRKEFFTKSKEWNIREEGTSKIEQNIILTKPPRNILPKQTRAVIRNFFYKIGINNVKILLLKKSTPEGFKMELIFNLTPDRFENNEEYKEILKSLYWYLPWHYSYSSVKESYFKKDFKYL